MNIAKTIADELGIKVSQVEAVIDLVDEGKTIPFIARYRKEAHGGLNDEQLRNLDTRLTYLRNLDERRAAILASIEEQGKLTAALKKQLEEAATLVALEDLYRPYKQKRRTRAMIAREKGLEGLARHILSPDAKEPVEKVAAGYVSEEKGVASVADAIAMAEDIIAEMVSDSAAFRTFIREKTLARGTIVSEAKDDKAASVYENYYHYEEPLSRLPGHRVLALNRGEKEKVLTVKVKAPEDEILRYLNYQLGVGRNAVTDRFKAEACADAYKRLIAPSVENEIRSQMTEDAEEKAIALFGKNLSQLLLQPPVAGKTVLGWDPAFRTGCKLAVVDATGKVLDTVVIYPTAPQNKVEEAKKTLRSLVDKYKVDVISLGNGTASRESEQVIVGFIKDLGKPLSYAIVNEAGASVYSASALATEEFPNFDVGQRSAASIARRLQDPLAELVKIDPRAIGVGQYQHDMNQTRLGQALTAVVEDCVNGVGVDVNTASAPLLGYISGINKTIAKNIVAYRDENGPFKSRRDLLKVPKLGPKAYELSAGFLRIRGGKEALDMTAVHPESYPAARQLLAMSGCRDEDIAEGHTEHLTSFLKGRDRERLAAELGIGSFTLADIIEELKKPGRDPRSEAQGPVLRTDVLAIEDLKEGMVLKGTVRNVIDFGAFVDIGVHQDGLVHISQMADKFVKHPLDVVKVGDIVTVKVLSVDVKKKRIGLTMKGV